MNTVTIAVISLIVLFLGYHLYGNIIDKKIVKPNDKNKTPAITVKGSIDFHPAKKWMLFGHHFSSIAGAGPIIGPVVGLSYFGWLPVLLWILVGSIFMGAFHDYLSLMISVRNKARSLADISGRLIGKRSRIILSLFVWLALVLIVAVFAIVAAQTLVEQPELVIPTFGLIAIAIVLGILVYRLNWALIPSTLIGLALMFYSIYLGDLFPVTITFFNPHHFWFYMLLLYSLVASLLPVWLLLQPRDYLCTYNLYIGLIAGFLGIAVARFPVHAPMYIKSTAAMPLWPMLFVLVACGAISGFHSLVAGGTTSKQLAKESEGRLVGFGAMLVEAAVAVMALLVVSGGLYWLKGQVGGFVFQTALKQGWIVTFGKGFGRVVEVLPFVNYKAAYFFGILLLNMFVLTTLDTSLRLARYVWEELTISFNVKTNPLVACSITLALVIPLGITNSWKVIWPVFGAANQLIAALVLLVIAAYLVSSQRIYALIPACFMMITTVVALAYQAWGFFTGEKNTILGCASLGLIVLAIIVGYDAWGVLRKKKRA